MTATSALRRAADPEHLTTVLRKAGVLGEGRVRDVQQLQQFTEDLAGFTDRVGERLSPGRRDLYARLIDCEPRLQMRYRSHRNMTIVQGDSHVWNCFLPRDRVKDDALLFDWDGWHVDVAAKDLSYMMAI